MKLYHGSTIDIQKIDLAKSKPNKIFDKFFTSFKGTSLARLCVL